MIPSSFFYIQKPLHNTVMLLGLTIKKHYHLSWLTIYVTITDILVELADVRRKRNEKNNNN